MKILAYAIGSGKTLNIANLVLENLDKKTYIFADTYKAIQIQTTLTNQMDKLRLTSSNVKIMFYGRNNLEKMNYLIEFYSDSNEDKLIIIDLDTLTEIEINAINFIINHFESKHQTYVVLSYHAPGMYEWDDFEKNYLF